jgi:hypothetical protein
VLVARPRWIAAIAQRADPQDIRSGDLANDPDPRHRDSIPDLPGAGKPIAAAARRLERPGSPAGGVRWPDTKRERAEPDHRFLRVSWAAGMTAGGLGDMAIGSSSAVPQK